MDKAQNRIQEACHGRKKPKIKPLAQGFGVNYQRLLRRVHGRNYRSTRPRTNMALDNAQEEALIGFLDDTIASPTRQDMRAVQMNFGVGWFYTTRWQKLGLRPLQTPS